MVEQVGDGGETLEGQLAAAKRRLDIARFEHGAQTAEVRAGTTIADRMGAAVRQAEHTLATLYEAEAERLNELFATGDVPLEQMIEQAFGLAASTARGPEELVAARAATERVLPELQASGTKFAVFADGDMRVHTTTFPACLGVNPHLSGGVVLIVPTDEYLSSPRHLSPQLVEVEPGRICERYIALQRDLIEACGSVWDASVRGRYALRCVNLARTMHVSGILLDDEASALMDQAFEPLDQYIERIMSRIAEERGLPGDTERYALLEAVDVLRDTKPEKIEHIIEQIVAGCKVRNGHIRLISCVPLLAAIIERRDRPEGSRSDLDEVRAKSAATVVAVDLLKPLQLEVDSIGE